MVRPFSLTARASLRSSLRVRELLAGEKQLAVALGIVTVEGTPPVFGYVHVLDIELTACEIAPAVHQRSLTGADGFYLRAGKDYSSGIVLKKLVFERGFLVADFYFALSLSHKGGKDSKNSTI